MKTKILHLLSTPWIKLVRIIFFRIGNYQVVWELVALLLPRRGVAFYSSDRSSQSLATVGMAEAEEVRGFMTSESTVLDLGCGLGKIARHLAPYCKSLYAADVSSVYLTRARKYLGVFDNVELCKVDGKTLDRFPDTKFDLVYSMGVFVHIRKKDVGNYLKEVYRVLKESGIFYLHLPAPGSRHPVYEFYSNQEMKDLLDSSPFIRDQSVIHGQSLRLVLRKASAAPKMLAS